MDIKQSGKKSFSARKNRINEEIKHSEVRLIDKEGKQVGVIGIKEALDHADSEGMDLVEIAADSEPPVCRIMDYGKYLFESNKKRSESRKKQKQIQVKEVKIRPTTEDNDYQVKLRSLKKFLENGDKARVSVRFKGREIAHQELGMTILNRIRDDLNEISTVEQEAKTEGRQMIMVLAPKKS